MDLYLGLEQPHVVLEEPIPVGAHHAHCKDIPTLLGCILRPQHETLNPTGSTVPFSKVWLWF